VIDVAAISLFHLNFLKANVIAVVYELS